MKGGRAQQGHSQENSPDLHENSYLKCMFAAMPCKWKSPWTEIASGTVLHNDITSRAQVDGEDNIEDDVTTHAEKASSCICQFYSLLVMTIQEW